MNYDIIVLGSGPGGYVAAIRASQLGLKTAIVEKESLGGICLNWGCIPTKALLKSAQLYNDIKHADDYGINVSGFDKNFDNVVKRSRNVADKMSKGVQFLMKKNKIDTIMGFGKLANKNELIVTDADGNEKTYQAKHIILATGSRAKELPNIKIDGEKVIEYRKAMTLPSQPKSMIVMGSGAIGVEFSYFYHSMDTEVTIVEFLDRIVPNEDEDISKELAKIFKKSGMNIHVSSTVQEVDTSGDGVVATVKTPEGEIKMEADVLLSAAGVVANIENIGLESLGVQTENGKVTVDKMYMTNIDGVYAIGDITQGQALAHVASKEAIICVENIAHKEGKFNHAPEPLDYNNVPGCTYCTPEIASVGLTESKAKELGYNVKIGKFPFSASGKASASGHNEGFVKVIFDAEYGEWLGTHMIGYNVTEMIAETVVGRKLETTHHEVLNAVHPHPTMSEAVMEAVAASQGEVIHL